MPRDANGVYTLPPSYHVQTGDTVLPVQHNPPFEDVANALTNSIDRDGRTVWTGNMQAGGNKVTGLGDPSLPGDAMTRRVSGIEFETRSHAEAWAGTSPMPDSIVIRGDASADDGMGGTYVLGHTSSDTIVVAGASYGRAADVADKRIVDKSIKERALDDGAVSLRALRVNVRKAVSLPDFRKSYSKRVFAELPIRGVGYEAIVAARGYNYIYMQCFFIDFDANEIWTGWLSNGGSDSDQWFRVFDITTGEEKTYFTFGAGGVSVNEMLHLVRLGSQRYMFARYQDRILGRANVTSLPSPMATVTADLQRDLDMYSQGTRRRRTFTIEQATSPIGQRRRRYLFGLYNSSTFNRIGTLDFGFEESGDLYEYQDYLPKRQSLAAGDGFYLAGYGGTAPSGAGTVPYHYQGVKVFDDAGNKVSEGLLDGQSFLNLLQDSGFECERVENEGVFVGPDNTCYSAVVTQGANPSTPYKATRGVIIFEEFSQEEDAIDFSSAAASSVRRPRLLPFYPRSADNKYYNWLTGSEISSLNDALDLMAYSDEPEIVFYSSFVSFRDIDNNPFPAAAEIRVRNMNNSTFYMSVVNAGSSREYLINGSPRVQTLLRFW